MNNKSFSHKGRSSPHVRYPLREHENQRSPMHTCTDSSKYVYRPAHENSIYINVIMKGRSLFTYFKKCS